MQHGSDISQNVNRLTFLVNKKTPNKTTSPFIWNFNYPHIKLSNAWQL